MDLTFAVASLSRFNVPPRENHLITSVKMLGYLKNYPKKGYGIDPSPFQANSPSNKVEHNFNHQCDHFKEHVDPRFLDLLLKELDTIVFVYENHGYDSVTGKETTSLLTFVGSTPVDWGAMHQPSVQTTTCGTELNALKKEVEHDVTIRCYLRSMGVKVEQLTRMHCDDKDVVTNTI